MENEDQIYHNFHDGYSLIREGNDLFSCNISSFIQIITGHADSSTDAIYVELQTEEVATILLSRGHLIHVGCHGNLKAARDVAIGDTVFVKVNSNLRLTKVTGVTETIKRGAYCPHTTGKYNLT